MPESLVINRKEQITQVAQTLFRERGYSATSMRDLANEIGIEAASLYSHIESKEEILQNTCFQLADKLFEAIEPIINSSLATEEKLGRAITAHVKVIAANVDASAVFLHDWRHLSEPKLGEFRALRKKYDNYFRRLIREGIEEGLFKDLGETFMVLTVFSVLNWIYDWYKPNGKITPEEIAENLSNIILKGIKK